MASTMHEVLQRLLFGFYCELKEYPERDVTFKEDLRPLPADGGWIYSTTVIAETNSKFASVVVGKAGVKRTPGQPVKAEVPSGPFASHLPSGTFASPLTGGAGPSGYAVPSGVVDHSGCIGGLFAVTVARAEEARTPYNFRHKRKGMCHQLH